ncbi:MAG: ADP-ribosylglycohydrolase family protein [Opitutus sp.]
MRIAIFVFPVALASLSAAPTQPAVLTLNRADYVDRVQAIWTGQIIAVLAALPFEHATASVRPIDDLPLKWQGKLATVAPVDDDWYYEMCAVRGFEKFGVHMTVEQLGQQWTENRCGSWGSSEQARLNLAKGIKAPDCGHPRYNKLWFTLGPQFSSDLYGALAPGRPNEAGRLAREFGHVNGFAEGTDGAVFTAAMISLGFVDTDPKSVIRAAARILNEGSPYRQCIDLVIQRADQGKAFGEIVNEVEDRWHREYPATNNAVANGGIVAAGLWFGGGDFRATLNLIARAADFTDADCNAANAASVIGAMHGMKALPAAMVEQLHDRIVGTGMGSVKEFTPPVDETISALAQRTCAIGEKMLVEKCAVVTGSNLRVETQTIKEQPLERFELGELTKYWNPAWTLERAGHGGAGGGMAGVRGITCLEGDILATYPRDEVRGCLLRRHARVGPEGHLTLEVASEPDRAWELAVYAENDLLTKRTVSSGSAGRDWQTITVDLKEYAGHEITLRLYQRVLVSGRVPGNALWRRADLD